ncbi:MAG: NACHT domain-containing protein, partial [Microcoleaceae cyanobacterium]
MSNENLLLQDISVIGQYEPETIIEKLKDEKINFLIEKIINNQHTNAELLELKQLITSTNLQIAKYITNIGEGKDVHIGDRTYHGIDAEKIKEIISTILKELKPPVVKFTVDDWKEVCQNALDTRKQRLTMNPLTKNDMYVPLRLNVKKDEIFGEISPKSGSQMFQANDDFFTQILKPQILKEGSKLAIVGKAGEGKTTLLWKIAQRVMYETEYVAIWVSLAALRGQTLENYLLERWLKNNVGETEVTTEMKNALISLFERGRVFLLLDGIDEMASMNPLEKFAGEITSNSWLASARLVVTCRQNVWDAEKNSLVGFDVYRNLDFAYPDGMKTFIQGWFKKPE